jgi:hypothetical protein
MKPNNPFFHRGPIHDPLYFWNRTEELAQAHHLTQISQSVAVVGPRRTGVRSRRRSSIWGLRWAGRFPPPWGAAGGGVGAKWLLLSLCGIVLLASALLPVERLWRRSRPQVVLDRS